MEQASADGIEVRVHLYHDALRVDSVALMARPKSKNQQVAANRVHPRSIVKQVAWQLMRDKSSLRPLAGDHGSEHSTDQMASESVKSSVTRFEPH